MTRTDARKLAEIITVSELKETILNAYSLIDDWTVPSKVNKGMSKGTAFNVLTCGEITENMHVIAKINIIREFSLYLPEKYRVFKKESAKTITLCHQDPKPLNASYYASETI